MEWKDPPPATGGPRHELDAEVDELKQHPGRWALVRENCVASARDAYVRRGCETTTRAAGGGKFNLYARWPVTESNQVP